MSKDIPSRQTLGTPSITSKKADNQTKLDHCLIEIDPISNIADDVLYFVGLFGLQTSFKVDNYSRIGWNPTDASNVILCQGYGYKNIKAKLL